MCANLAYENRLRMPFPSFLPPRTVLLLTWGLGCLMPLAPLRAQTPAPAASLAPERPNAPYHLGLVLEPNWAFAMPRDYTHEALESRLHFGFGFVFDYKFTDRYAVGTGVNVFRTGGVTGHLVHVVDSARIDFVEQRMSLQYVEVPLTFKMRTKEIGYTTYFGRFGVGLGINVRAEADVRRHVSWAQNQLADPPIWVPTASTETPAFTRTDVAASTALFRPAMIVGLGMERRLLGSTAVVLGVTYNLGLRTQFIDTPIVRTDASGQPVNEAGVSFGAVPTDAPPGLRDMAGKVGFLSLTAGLMF